MIGFCNKALILFPKKETFNNFKDQERLNFNNQVAQIFKYLGFYEIRPTLVSGDDFGLEYSSAYDFDVIELLSLYDRVFAKKYCGYESPSNCVDVQHIYRKVDKRFPIDTNKSLEKQLEDVTKRVDKVFKEVEKEFRFIIDLQQKSNSNYKITVKEEDKLIIKRKEGIILETLYYGVKINPYNILGREFPFFIRDVK